MTIKTTEKDLGYKKILEQFKEIAKDPYVKVGIVKDEKHQDGTSLALIASSNEFGTDDGRVPERSFMRSTADKERRNVKNLIDKGYKDIIKGRETVFGLLTKVGLYVTGKTQQTITDLDNPENAPSTIKGKGSSNPLIDTGLMRQSIRHEVVKDGSK